MSVVGGTAFVAARVENLRKECISSGDSSLGSPGESVILERALTLLRTVSAEAGLVGADLVPGELDLNLSIFLCLLLLRRRNTSLTGVAVGADGFGTSCCGGCATRTDLFKFIFF